MNRTIASLLLTIMSVIGYGFLVYAAPPSGGYNPADTLQPNCNPGDTDCFVKLITYTTGGVVGTGRPTDPIALKFLFENSSTGLVSLGTGASSDSSHSNSIFIGLNAGSGSSGIDGSAFIGTNAGANTSASYSNFMGINSGADATNASNSNFFGFNSGASATNANDSSFFGNSAGYGAEESNRLSLFVSSKASTII